MRNVLRADRYLPNDAGSHAIRYNFLRNPLRLFAASTMNPGFTPASHTDCNRRAHIEADGSHCPHGPQSVRFTLFETPGPALGCDLSVGGQSRKARRSMDASQSPIWFIGDLDDPWIVEIAESIASVRSIRRLDCPGSLPDLSIRPHAAAATDRPPSASSGPRTTLCGSWTGVSLKARTAPPAVFLCISPYVRYVELERCQPSGRPRRLRGDGRRGLAAARRSPVERERTPGLPARRDGLSGSRSPVATTRFGRALIEACGTAGYRAEAVDEQEIGGILRGRHSRLAADHGTGADDLGESRCSSRAGRERLRARALSDRAGHRAGGIRGSRDRRPRPGQRGRRVPRTPVRSG